MSRLERVNRMLSFYRFGGRSITVPGKYDDTWILKSKHVIFKIKRDTKLFRVYLYNRYLYELPRLRVVNR